MTNLKKFRLTILLILTIWVISAVIIHLLFSIYSHIFFVFLGVFLHLFILSRLFVFFEQKLYIYYQRDRNVFKKTLNVNYVKPYYFYFLFRSYTRIKRIERSGYVYNVYSISLLTQTKKNHIATNRMEKYFKKNKLQQYTTIDLFYGNLIYDLKLNYNIDIKKRILEFQTFLINADTKSFQRYPQTKIEHLIEELGIIYDALNEGSKMKLLKVMEDFYYEESFMHETLYFCTLLYYINKNYHFNLDTGIIKSYFFKYEEYNPWLEIINN